MNVTAHRRQEILDTLQSEPFVAVDALAARFGCSDMTIRRDLAHLESKGLVERSRGGAAPTRRMKIEFAFSEKAGIRAEDKRAIGRAAAGLIRDGERILLDTGTTTLALARELCGRQDLTVITSSLAALSVFIQAPGVECTLLGGTVRESSPDLHGPLLEDTLSRIHADWAFIGCDGITVAGGLTTTDMRIARATGLMIANSSKVALLTDSSKAAENAFVRFATFKDIDYLITDAGMPADILDTARAERVEVVTVRPDDGK